MTKLKRLNIQGLARREGLLQRCFPAPENTVYVSIDLAAGEPTTTTHFSQDSNYRYATFDGVGQRPFYRNGVLMIGDIYLMSASINPLHSKTMEEAFNKSWPSGTFADQWVTDDEVIKKYLKAPRVFNKMAALGFSYGMGAKKFVKQAYDQGFSIDLRSAKALHTNYWELFADVRKFANRLAKQREMDGFIVNPFGYRSVAEPHKAFNAFIQSSVSGIMHVYLSKLAAISPYMELITVIHDELLVKIPKELIEQFRKDSQAATDSLNVDLGWSVNIRTGFAVGYDFYDAK